ncbi:hypothetical protein FKW77_001920 [Venturia effusa]|uniref:Uncharacterized protein n=1 Tax=Venturia effusa TaxID=50376 RepID=A0A517L2U5_9PEZI|nr:hypothetical protein FKW77_001920 [Venturia effusa]
MSTAKPKSQSESKTAKRITFLDLPPEMRQEVFLVSFNDDELQNLFVMDVRLDNKTERVIRNLDCRIEFNKQATTLRAVHLALIEDVDFAKKKWLDVHGELMANWEEWEPGCWT